MTNARSASPGRSLASVLAQGMALGLALGALPKPAAAQAQPAAAASKAAGPADALPYSAGVAARFAPPRVELDAPVFHPLRRGFTNNAELAEQIESVARSAAGHGTGVEVLVPGRSQRGEPIRALRFSRAPARPSVLIVGQQHGDEPAGAEALLLLLRELASGALSSVLERIDVVVLPRANPDGAMQSARLSANGIDINRDHLLLRTPEARAVAALAQAQRPVVVVDAHEYTAIGGYLHKFKALRGHDVLLQYATTANLPPELAHASESWFRRPLVEALEAEGLRTDWYHTNPVAPADLGLSMGGVQPDNQRNAFGLRHAISLLVESRGVGIGRLHLQRRVHSQLVAMRTILRSAAAHADDLVALQRRVDADASAAACRGQIVVQVATTPTWREVRMLDPATGDDKPVRVQWDSALELRVLKQRQRPCGYWLDADQPLALDSLRRLGVKVEPIDAERLLDGEAWIERARLELTGGNARGGAGDAAVPIVRVEVDLAARRFAAAPGSFYVPLDQPLAHLVVAALEPDTPSSFFAHGLVTRLDGALRVLAPR